MLFSLLYMLLRVIFRLAPSGNERDREVEILVLRHQVKVLKRKAGRPKLRRRDRLFLAAAASILPRSRWSCFIISPATLLRWHRELVREGNGPTDGPEPAVRRSTRRSASSSCAWPKRTPAGAT